jgi:hypothetical protein
VTLLGLRGGFAGFAGAVVGSGKLRELPPFYRNGVSGSQSLRLPTISLARTHQDIFFESASMTLVG